MNGTITIVVEEPCLTEMSVSMNMTQFDRLILIDAFAEVLELDEIERFFMGKVFAKGGLKNLPGIDMTSAQIPRELYDLLKKGKEQDGTGN